MFYGGNYELLQMQSSMLTLVHITLIQNFIQNI